MRIKLAKVLIILLLICCSCKKEQKAFTGFEYAGFASFFSESETMQPLSVLRTTDSGKRVADLFSCLLLMDYKDSSFINRIRILYLLKVIDSELCTSSTPFHYVAYTYLTIYIVHFCRLCEVAHDQTFFNAGKRMALFYINRVNVLVPELGWNFDDLMSVSVGLSKTEND